eukprot:TRINITY_DN139_c0_g1_i13.p2 TRINITY_DN139_c0_g1~~TRINITY_DN139_c0_g1_i13.p2  ORF type:complete len:243 (+),score=17.73 TRINITY_DN139_c0_g1_i13:2924-3652(+)
MRSRQLCELAVQLVEHCAALNMVLVVRHMPGRLNLIADGLSRQSPLSTEWSLDRSVFALIRNHFPSMTIDLFATRHNAQLELFVSPFPDPLALESGGRVGLRLGGEGSIRLSPLSPHPSDAQTSRGSAMQDDALKLPAVATLLRQSLNGSLHKAPESMNLHAWRICGGSYVLKDDTDSSTPVVPLLDYPSATQHGCSSSQASGSRDTAQAAAERQSSQGSRVTNLHAWRLCGGSYVTKDFQQ